MSFFGFLFMISFFSISQSQSMGSTLVSSCGCLLGSHLTAHCKRFTFMKLSNFTISYIFESVFIHSPVLWASTNILLFSKHRIPMCTVQMSLEILLYFSYFLYSFFRFSYVLFLSFIFLFSYFHIVYHTWSFVFSDRGIATVTAKQLFLRVSLQK